MDIINKEGHLISSMLIMLAFMGSYLAFLLLELGAIRIITTIFISIGFFLFGCTLPDWDHPAVQKKIHLKFLGRITKHRGHFHSLVAMCVYGAIIFVFVWLINFYYWIYPVIIGMGGYLSHLVEDDLNRFKLKSKPQRGLKIF